MFDVCYVLPPPQFCFKISYILNNNTWNVLLFVYANYALLINACTQQEFYDTSVVFKTKLYSVLWNFSNNTKPSLHGLLSWSVHSLDLLSAFSISHIVFFILNFAFWIGNFLILVVFFHVNYQIIIKFSTKDTQSLP